MIFEEKQKSQQIEKRQVWEAFKKVQRNAGTPRVDKLYIAQVCLQTMKYLYPVWNRLASGSYFPMPVREVEIPKQDGMVVNSEHQRYKTVQHKWLSEKNWKP